MVASAASMDAFICSGVIVTSFENNTSLNPLAKYNGPMSGRTSFETQLCIKEISGKPIRSLGFFDLIQNLHHGAWYTDIWEFAGHNYLHLFPEAIVTLRISDNTPT